MDKCLSCERLFTPNREEWMPGLCSECIDLLVQGKDPLSRDEVQ